MKKLLILVLIGFILLLGSLLIIYKTSFFVKPEKITATSTITTISTKGDWDQGDVANIISSESGNIQISEKGIGDLLYDIGQNHPEQITVSHHEEMKVNAVDSNDSTIWNGVNNFFPGDPSCTEPIPDSWWQVDLGEVRTDIKRFRHYTSTGMPQDLQLSTDGINFTSYQTVYAMGSWNEIDVAEPITARYVRLFVHFSFPFSLDFCPDYQNILGFEILSDATATHTTHAIDGGENFWEWEANTIVQTVPANTSATYQYRTSANGSDWTAWVGNIGSVTNRTGDDSDNPTRYRYLQIKATLTNTDGVSTPTIDSYTIDYHTNQKPTTPTTQTAVMQ